MQTRSIIVVCIILSFTAGLAVASFAGFREFLPGLLEGARITVLITVLGCALAVVMAFLAAIARMYGPAPLRWLAITYIERSEEHTSELQSLMRISYAVFCLKKKKNRNK